MPGKKINQLPFLGNPNNEGMIPLEYSGTTYHIKFSSVTQNITDNIIYTGEDIKCLNIENNMSLTQVIQTMGGTLCNSPIPINPCLNIIEEDNGECKNAMKYLLDTVLLYWCNQNPPYNCEGENIMENFINYVYTTWENGNN
jgi:hypothetical protein